VNREAWNALRLALGLAWPVCALSLLGPGGIGVGAEPAADSLVAPALRRDASRALLLLRLLLELLHLLHQALLQNLVQQGMLLHDLARQQRMLQGLLQYRMLLHQLGRGLRVLQGLLQQRVHLQELLRQDRVLQDGLQERVLLQRLSAADLLVLALRLAVAALRRAELLQHALLQDLVQHGVLLHDLARQQRMLQGLLQPRVLLDQLGRGLRVLQGGLHDRVRLEELLRQGRLLQDGLQQRVLLELAALLLVLDVGAEGLRAAGEAANATTKALRLELLRSGSLLFKLRHVRLLVVE
jgi:hypothetical protein